MKAWVVNMISPLYVNPNYYYTRSQAVNYMQISEASFSKYFLMQVPENAYGKRVKYLGKDLNTRINQLTNTIVPSTKEPAYIDFRKQRQQYLSSLPKLTGNKSSVKTLPVILADNQNPLFERIIDCKFDYKFNIPKNCLRKPCVYRADALAFPVPGYKLLALDTVNNWVTAMPTACLPNTFNIDVFYSIMNGVQSGYYSYSNECLTIIKHRINLIQMNSLQCNGQLIDLNNSYNQLKSIIAEFDS